VLQKILHCLQVRDFGSLPAIRTTSHPVRTLICSLFPAVQTTCHTVRTSFRLKHHPSRHSSVSRSFCSNLHPSGRLNSLSVRRSVFNQASDFLSKSKYGKIAATVRTKWIPVRTPVYHGPDARTTDMEIACRRSTFWMAILLVRTREALIRKLLAADVRPSERQCLTVWTRLLNRKDFQRKSRNFGHTVVRPDGP
jgi:hypothetical protein